jgi:hypothetical protein
MEIQVYSSEWFKRLGKISATQALISKENFKNHGQNACLVCGDESTIYGQTDTGLKYQFCNDCGKFQAGA